MKPIERGLLFALAFAVGIAGAQTESIIEQWAEVATRAKYEDLSPEVVQRVKLSVLDSIGVMLFSAGTPASELYLEKPLANGGRPEAIVWGAGKRLPVETAAACDAFLVHGHEIDDTDLRSGVKISCITAAPALAVADYLHASGKDFILASAIAYTVTGRLAAVTPSMQWMGYMPSGIWGPGGAAAATAKLLGLDKEPTVWALGLALGGGQGSFQYWWKQTQDKKVIVARAARIGVESTLLAQKGWRGPRRILEGRSGIYHNLMNGYVDATALRAPIERGLQGLFSGGNVGVKSALLEFEPNWDVLTRDFNKLDGPMYVYPKFQACSASIGPFLDALDPVWEKKGFDAGEIDRVIVARDWPLESEFAKKVLHFEPPKTVVGAQMNMNFVISLYLDKGSASPHEFVPEALDNPDILDLARRVTLEYAPPGTKWFIKIVPKRGDALTVSFMPDFGEKYEPLMYEARMKKFRVLTRDVLDDEGRARVLEMVERLESVEDMSKWTDEVHSLLR